MIDILLAGSYLAVKNIKERVARLERVEQQNYKREFDSLVSKDVNWLKQNYMVSKSEEEKLIKGHSYFEDSIIENEIRANDPAANQYLNSSMFFQMPVRYELAKKGMALERDISASESLFCRNEQEFRENLQFTVFIKKILQQKISKTLYLYWVGLPSQFDYSDFEKEIYELSDKTVSIIPYNKKTANGKPLLLLHSIKWYDSFVRKSINEEKERISQEKQHERKEVLLLFLLVILLMTIL